MMRPPPTSTLFPYTPLSLSSPLPAVAPTARPRCWPGTTTRPATQPGSWTSAAVWGHARRQPDPHCRTGRSSSTSRSEEHTSELQSQSNLVCRLLLEKNKVHEPSILIGNFMIGNRQQLEVHPFFRTILLVCIHSVHADAQHNRILLRVPLLIALHIMR